MNFRTVIQSSDPRVRLPGECTLAKNWQCEKCRRWKPWGANSCHDCYPPYRGNGIRMSDLYAWHMQEQEELKIANGEAPRYHLPKYTQADHRAAGGFVHFWSRAFDSRPK